MSDIPACFIVDDAPANATYWMRLQQSAYGWEVDEQSDFGRQWRTLERSPWFDDVAAERFADMAEEIGLRGKFTVLPCPAGLGRIDERVRQLPEERRRRFLEIIRRRIAPRFDITPECLTHSMAFDVAREALLPHTETAYLSSLASRGAIDELSKQIRHGYDILTAAGLAPHGLTLGGMGDPSGIAGGRMLTQGYHRDVLGEALLRVERERQPTRLRSFIFTGARPQSAPSRLRRAPEPVFRGASGTVYDIHALDDPLVPMLRGEEGPAAAILDSLVTPDGAGGLWVEAAEAGQALVLVTHGQTLMSNGTYLGLRTIRGALRRLADRYGKRIVWHTTDELCGAVGADEVAPPTPGSGG